MDLGFLKGTPHLRDDGTVWHVWEFGFAGNTCVALESDGEPVVFEGHVSGSTFMYKPKRRSIRDDPPPVGWFLWRADVPHEGTAFPFHNPNVNVNDFWVILREVARVAEEFEVLANGHYPEEPEEYVKDHDPWDSIPFWMKEDGGD